MNVGDLVGGRFRLEALRGEGGMGRVFRARDLTTGEAVAVKTVSGWNGGRFAREAEALAQLRHPNIVGYVARGDADGAPWLAMEWLDGFDLAERLVRGPLDARATRALARCVASALAAAHAQGIVHRDVKPANVFLPNGDAARAKVLDFGVARVLDVARATATGTILGTLGYMAPEQARGHAGVGPAADLFSLGCVLYECLGGRPAFAGDHAVAVLAKVLLETPPPLVTKAGRGRVPPDLARLVAELLEKDPARRPQGAAAVLARLDAPSGDDVTRAALPEIAGPPSGTGLGLSEQALVSVVLVATEATPWGATVPFADDGPPRRIADAAAQHGGTVAELLGGALVTTVPIAGTPRDQARRAARCALAMHAAAPHAPIVLCTGRTIEGERAPVGEVLDRGAALLRRSSPNEATGLAVRIDDVTAALLGDTFEVAREGEAWFLVGERAAGRATPARRFFGREREVASLLALVDECVSEPAARAMLVVGPPGIGKSALVDEALRRLDAGAGDAPRWRAEADAVTAGAPFGLLARIVRSAAGLEGADSGAEKRTRLRALAARHVPAAEVDGVAFGLFALCGAMPLEPTAAEDAASRVHAPADVAVAMIEAWDALVAGACASERLVLVLEDVQWADAPSLRALDAALRRHEGHGSEDAEICGAPLFVLATARPEIAEVVPSLWSGRAVQTMRLGGLGRRAASELVVAHVGAGADPALVQSLLAHGGGNPFFLAELARAANEGRSDPIPETVVGMVEARLRTLDPEDRRLLRAASLLGTSFPVDGVAALLGAGPGAPSAAAVEARLEALVPREILRRAGDGRGHPVRYAFAHALVREAAYAMLVGDDRRLGHSLAAAWLERHGDAEPMVVAHHWAAAGETARAVSAYESAARDAALRGDHDAVLVYADRALALDVDGETRGHLLALAGEALMSRGDLDGAYDRATLALTLLPSGSPDWHLASRVTMAKGFTRFARSFSS